MLVMKNEEKTKKTNLTKKSQKLKLKKPKNKLIFLFEIIFLTRTFKFL